MTTTTVVLVVVALAAIQSGKVFAAGDRDMVSGGSGEKIVPDDSLIYNDETIIDSVIEFRDGTVPDDSYTSHFLRGYNIYQGNPTQFAGSSGIDPGYKLKIFKRGEGVEFYPAVACSVMKTGKEIKSAYGYHRDLSLAVHAKQKSGAGLFRFFFKASASFSGSLETKQMIRKITHENQVVIIEEAKCSEQEIKLNSYRPPHLSEGFVDALKYVLRDIENDEKWHTLYDNYGTHFVTDMTVGSKYMNITTMEVSTYMQAKDFFANFGFEGKFNAEMVLPISRLPVFVENSMKGSLGAGINVNKNTLDSWKTTEHKSITYGSRFNGKEIYSWASEEHPDPLPLTTLISPLENLFEEGGAFITEHKDLLKNREVLYRRCHATLINYCREKKRSLGVEHCRDYDTTNALDASLQIIKFNNILEMKRTDEGYYIHSLDSYDAIAEDVKIFSSAHSDMNSMMPIYGIRFADPILWAPPTSYKMEGKMIPEVTDEETVGGRMNFLECEEDFKPIGGVVFTQQWMENEIGDTVLKQAKLEAIYKKFACVHISLLVKGYADKYIGTHDGLELWAYGHGSPSNARNFNHVYAKRRDAYFLEARYLSKDVLNVDMVSVKKPQHCGSDFMSSCLSPKLMTPLKAEYINGCHKLSTDMWHYGDDMSHKTLDNGDEYRIYYPGDIDDIEEIDNYEPLDCFYLNNANPWNAYRLDKPLYVTEVSFVVTSIACTEDYDTTFYSPHFRKLQVKVGMSFESAKTIGTINLPYYSDGQEIFHLDGENYLGNKIFIGEQFVAQRSSAFYCAPLVYGFERLPDTYLKRDMSTAYRMDGVLRSLRDTHKTGNTSIIRGPM